MLTTKIVAKTANNHSSEMTVFIANPTIEQTWELVYPKFPNTSGKYKALPIAIACSQTEEPNGNFSQMLRVR